MNSINKSENILVIKLSALGDFIQCFGAMRAIRNHHPDAHITLLTSKPYKELGEKSNYFDEIIIDKRPKLFDLKGWVYLSRLFNAKKFNRVYDLQCNDRTNIYHKLFLKKPEWIGTAKGATHRNTDPNRKAGLAFYGHKQTLALGGVNNVEIDTMEWIVKDSNFGLNKPYALIASGCAPSRPAKRWDASLYGALCQKLQEANIQPVLLGTDDEKSVTDEISSLCPEAINLTGKTSLFDLAPLAREASIAIGNDTGPMHFFGPTGCKCLVLFSGKSDPERHRPLGKDVHTIQKDNINDISVKDIMDKAKKLLGH